MIILNKQPREQIAIAWDIDGVFYSFQALEGVNFYNIAIEANAIAATKLMPMTFEHAVDVAVAGYKQFGDCCSGFLAQPEAEGLDQNALKLGVFQGYHRELYQIISDRHPTYFDHAKEDLVELFEAGKSFMKHGVVTHACMDNWGYRLLGDIGVLPYMQKNAMLGMNQYDFLRKDQSPVPVQTVMNLLHDGKGQKWFADDSIKNLQKSKEIAEMRTACIYQGVGAPEPKDYIDQVHQTPAKFMRHLLDIA